MKRVNCLDIHKYCKYCKYCKYQKILKYIEINCKILRYINGPKIDNFQPVTLSEWQIIMTMRIAKIAYATTNFNFK